MGGGTVGVGGACTESGSAPPPCLQQQALIARRPPPPPPPPPHPRTCLPANLRCNVVVRQASGREEGDLLAARDGVHHVDRGDAGLDHLLGVGALRGVDGRAVDVQMLLCQHGGAARSGGRDGGGGGNVSVETQPAGRHARQRRARAAAPCTSPTAGAHPPSMGRPEPLKTRPSMSRDTGVMSTCTRASEGQACVRFAPPPLLCSPGTRLPSPPPPPPPTPIPFAPAAHLARKLERGAPVVNARRPLKHLHHGAVAVHLQHLPAPGAAVPQLELHDLRIFGLLRGVGLGWGGRWRGVRAWGLQRRAAGRPAPPTPPPPHAP